MKPFRGSLSGHLGVTFQRLKRDLLCAPPLAVPLFQASDGREGIQDRTAGEAVPWDPCACPRWPDEIGPPDPNQNSKATVYKGTLAISGKLYRALIYFAFIYLA